MTEGNFMTPDAMLNVRMSHAMYNEHWHKAIDDIIFLQDKGAKHDVEIINKLRECRYCRVFAGY
jgi:hypothetical protein